MIRRISDLRIHNTRGVIGELLCRGSASRAELARAMHVSKPTIGEITAELMERGLIQEVDLDESLSRTRGRPSTPIRLDGDRPRFLLIQIGVQQTRLAVLPLHVEDADTWELTIRTPESTGEFRSAMRQAVEELFVEGLAGMVIGVPGLVDESAGRVIFSPNLRWLDGCALVDLFQSVVALPAVLMQEIKPLALGHQLQYGDDNFLLIDVAEGLGGAAVINGQLFESPLPIAMEIGHAQIVGQDLACGCGGTGCLETLFSTVGLLRAWNGAHEQGFRKWSRLADHLKGQAGERTDWIAPILDAAGSVIASTLNTLGVKRVVFTGAASDLPKTHRDMLSQHVKQHSLWGRLADIECVFCPRYRVRGMVATGIDRLIAPLPDSVVHHLAS